MIVVDTNIIAYLWIPGEHTTGAERLLRQDPDWAVPLLWRSEFRNVLGEHSRVGRLSLELAIQMVEEAERFFAGREYSVPSSKVLAAAASSGCSAYDCEFIVLAEDLDVALVTTDRQVLREFPKRAVTVEQALSKH